MPEMLRFHLSRQEKYGCDHDRWRTAACAASTGWHWNRDDRLRHGELRKGGSMPLQVRKKGKGSRPPRLRHKTIWNPSTRTILQNQSGSHQLAADLIEMAGAMARNAAKIRSTIG